MAKVLELANRYDIANNPDPKAIFDPGIAGFQIWCTPDDHPAGWSGVPMDTGAFTKPCKYVASAMWGWEGDKITHLVLSTDAFSLREYHIKNGEYGPYSKYKNRPADLSWAKDKITWLFRQADTLVPIIKTNMPMLVE